MTGVDTWTEIEVVTGHATNPSVADSRTASILKEGHVLGVGNQVTGCEEHSHTVAGKWGVESVKASALNPCRRWSHLQNSVFSSGSYLRRDDS